MTLVAPGQSSLTVRRIFQEVPLRLTFQPQAFQSLIIC